MKYYEMLAVLPGTMTEEEVKSSVDEISQIITKFEASDVTVEDMGKSRLAYPIKHIRYGYFQLFRFNLEEANVTKLEKEMRLLDKTLRVAVSVCDPNTVVSYKLALDPTAPSAKPKADKPGREERKSKPAPKADSASDSKSEEKVEASEEKSVEDKKETTETVEEVKEKKVEKPVEAKAEKTKMTVEDIDKKLDEILQDDIDKV